MSWYRRRPFVALTGLLLLIAGGIAAARLDQLHPERLSAIQLPAAGSPSTTLVLPTLPPPPAVDVTPSAPPPGPATPVAVGVTSTTKPCRNSHDPGCGPFRWDPAPAQNQPLELSAAADPDHSSPGQVVHFTLRAHDPDADISPCISYDFGDGTGSNQVYGTPCQNGRTSCDRYGPWDPPAPKTGATKDFAFDHTYRSTGAYPVRIYAYSGTPGGCADPFASDQEIFLTVRVSEPATTTTTQ